jgi:hypothetical protein
LFIKLDDPEIRAACTIGVGISGYRIAAIVGLDNGYSAKKGEYPRRLTNKEQENFFFN